MSEVQSVNNTFIKSALYLAHALRIPVFATDSSRNDEKVIKVVRSLNTLKAGVVRPVKCDGEIRLKHVRFVRVATTECATSEFGQNRSSCCSKVLP